MHKSLNEFEFGSDRIIHFRVIALKQGFLIPGAIYMC